MGFCDDFIKQMNLIIITFIELINDKFMLMLNGDFVSNPKNHTQKTAYWWLKKNKKWQVKSTMKKS
jgi:hypothetical protein